MTCVKVGIIGLGEVAQIIHLPILASMDDRFGIAAICDISPSLLRFIGERYRVPEAMRSPKRSATPRPIWSAHTGC